MRNHFRVPTVDHLLSWKNQALQRIALSDTRTLGWEVFVCEALKNFVITFGFSLFYLAKLGNDGVSATVYNHICMTDDMRHSLIDHIFEKLDYSGDMLIEIEEIVLTSTVSPIGSPLINDVRLFMTPIVGVDEDASMALVGVGLALEHASSLSDQTCAIIQSILEELSTLVRSSTALH